MQVSVAAARESLKLDRLGSNPRPATINPPHGTQRANVPKDYSGKRVE